MSLGKAHEIHRRRFGRNLGLGLALGGLVVLIFGLTIVKVTEGGLLEAYDHQPRASVGPLDATATGAGN